MNDAQVVYFDAFNSAGPGPDTRARVQGEIILGPVHGVSRTINLEDVRRVQFGVEEKDALPHLIHAVVIGVALLAVYLFVTFEFTAR